MKEEKSEPILTLKERIKKTVSESWIETEPEGTKENLEKNIFSLIQRVLHPEQFCPKCDERMFLEPDGFSCPNCGFKSEKFVPPVNPNNPNPQVRRPTGPIPPQVARLLEQEERPTQPIDPTVKNIKYNKKSLAAAIGKMQSGNTATTQQDIDVVKQATGNNNINMIP